MLERNRPLHVRRSVVNDLGKGHKPVVHLEGLVDILGKTRVEQLLHSLRDDLTVTDEVTVTVPRSVNEVFVVTSEDGFAGASLAENGDLGVPSSHIANTVLESEDVRLG